MTDIEQFIRARLAEDEERTRSASPGPWETVDRGHQIRITDATGATVATWEQEDLPDYLAHLSDSWDVQHIVTTDPAAAERRIALIRAMLRHADDAADNERALEEEAGWRVRDYDKSPLADTRMHRDIAAYWSTHPDYRPEWAPVPELVGPPAPPCQHNNVVAHGKQDGMYRWHCADCQLSYSFSRNLADCDVVYFLHRVAQAQR